MSYPNFEKTDPISKYKKDFFQKMSFILIRFKKKIEVIIKSAIYFNILLDLKMNKKL